MEQNVKYIAYISLDYLDQVFTAYGWRDRPDEQMRFIKKLHRQIEEFIKGDKLEILDSWMWTDATGHQRYAFELLPVKTSTDEPVFISEHLWKMLKDEARATVSIQGEDAPKDREEIKEYLKKQRDGEE